MNKLYTSSIVTALSFFGAALAQGQQQQTAPPEWPQPSTSETEGTAADRTAPGEMPKQGMPGQMESKGQMENQMEHPRPATSPTEGTAADHSPPGKTPTMQQGEMVGAKVVSQTDAPLGVDGAVCLDYLTWSGTPGCAGKPEEMARAEFPRGA